MSARLYKLIYDISVLYTIGALLFGCFRGILDIRLYLVLLLSMCISLITEEKRTLQILVTIIIPLIAMLVLAPTIPELAIFLLTLAYSYYEIATRKGPTSRGEFIDLFRKTLLFLLLLCLLFLAVNSSFRAVLLAACPYFMLILISTVLLLRSLRINNQADIRKKYQGYQLIELFSFLIISLILAIIKTPQNILVVLRLIYLRLIHPLLTLLAWVLSILLSGIINLFIILYQFITNNKEVHMVQIDLGSTAAEAVSFDQVQGVDNNWVWNAIYFIGGILGIIVLFLFMRRLMGRKLKQSIPLGISEIRENISENEDKKATLIRRKPKDTREAVRYYYQKNILWLQHKKVKLKQQDTTEDINYKYHTIPGEEADANNEKWQATSLMLDKDASTELMLLYQRARYHKDEPITEVDVKKAKLDYHNISKRKKN